MSLEDKLERNITIDTRVTFIPQALTLGVDEVYAMGIDGSFWTYTGTWTELPPVPGSERALQKELGNNMSTDEAKKVLDKHYER